MRVQYFLNSLVEEFGSIASLIYNEMEEMEEGDVEKIVGFLDGFSGNSASLVLHGDGGYLDTALTLGVYLRNRFKELSTIIVKKAASAKSYVALLSDRLVFVQGAYLTQFDLAFLYKDKIYRALNELESQNPVIQRKARTIWGLSFKLIKKIIDRKDSISKRSKISDDYVREIMSVCMKKSSHSKKISFEELKTLDFKVSKIDGEISNTLKMFVDHILSELESKNKRFFISFDKESRWY